MWRRHWKLFHNRSSKNVSRSGNIDGLSRVADQGEYFEGDHSPNTPSWRGAQLKKKKYRDNFTCTFYPSQLSVSIQVCLE
jgi:hypothetical protein